MISENRFSSVLIHRLAAFAAMVLLAAAPAVAQELPSSEYKGGNAIRQAFREVVKEAREYTVQVLSKDRQIALGTIVESEGFILTKASQLEGDDLFVRLSTGKLFPTSLVGVYPEFDLGLLKIDARDLPVVEWHRSFEVDLGSWLATPGIGEIPVAVGVVAARPRSIPLVHGQLGVTFAQDGPAEVTAVLPDSAAEKAGIQVGDIILMVSGKSVHTGQELRAAVQDHRPGEGIVLRIRRNDQDFDVIATLGNPVERMNTKSVMQNNWGGTLSVRRAGFTSALQHDTVLSAEDCGGPIVDLSGKAIGINIARAGRTESFTLLARQITPMIADLKSGRLAPLKPEKLQLLADQGRSVPEPSAPATTPNLVRDTTRSPEDAEPQPVEPRKRRQGFERSRRN